MARMPAALELDLPATLIAVSLGVPLELIAGLQSDEFIGKTIMAALTLGSSLPAFWVGLMLIMLFAVFLGGLPSNECDETINFLGAVVARYKFKA